MNLCVIGTGYVGLVTGTCLAEMGNNVICVDNDAAKVATLSAGEVPIFEPQLKEYVDSNTAEGRLSFTTDLADAVRRSLICFIAVGTPQGEDGAADLTTVFDVARGIAEAMNDYKVIVTKSTVPVGTAARIRRSVAKLAKHPFAVVSNPEFLKQGDAVNDFLKPERVVIGIDDDPRARSIMGDLYAPFLRTGNPIMMMDIPSAEMTKYVANCFLATKISFINEMSQLCEKVGADIDDVRRGIGTDSRIGTQFMFPGLGYGGSCFPKDVKALLRTAQEHGVESPIIDAVDRVNRRQRDAFIQKVLHHFDGDVEGRTLAVWGLSFKPRTDDLRDAPSLTIIRSLAQRGARLRAFDPRAMANAEGKLPARVQLCESAYEALEGADALLLVTEWNEFRRPDFTKMKRLLKSPVVFDGRNIWEPERMAALGFTYYCVGRPYQPTTEPTLA